MAVMLALIGLCLLKLFCTLESIDTNSATHLIPLRRRLAKQKIKDFTTEENKYLNGVALIGKSAKLTNLAGLLDEPSFCTGALIHTVDGELPRYVRTGRPTGDYILTSSHCFYSQEKSKFKSKSGISVKFENKISCKIEWYRVSKMYQDGNDLYDVAIAKLYQCSSPLTDIHRFRVDKWKPVINMGGLKRKRILKRAGYGGTAQLTLYDVEMLYKKPSQYGLSEEHGHQLKDYKGKGFAHHKDDGQPGDSGGPVFKANSHEIIAVFNGVMKDKKKPTERRSVKLKDDLLRALANMLGDNDETSREYGSTKQ